MTTWQLWYLPPAAARFRAAQRRSLFFFLPHPPWGDVTRVWREALLANQRAAQAWQHYLLLLLLTDKEEVRRETWAGSSSSASRRVGGGRSREEAGGGGRGRGLINQSHWRLKSKSCHKESAWYLLIRGLMRQWPAACSTFSHPRPSLNYVYVSLDSAAAFPGFFITGRRYAWWEHSPSRCSVHRCRKTKAPNPHLNTDVLKRRKHSCRSW